MNTNTTFRRLDLVRASLFSLACAIALSGAVPTASAAENAPDSAPAASAPAVRGTVNVNTATVAQLSQLPRIGEKLAQRIVDYRKEHGSFKKVDELMAVKGIGEKFLEVLKPYVAVSGDTTLSEKVRAGKSRRSKKSDESRG